MILNVSGRTDIVAFYTPWFLNRYHEGFVDVRNPFYPKLVSRIYFKDVDLIVFCTKNPHPLIPYLKEFKEPILFQITITSYKKDIEPNVIDKKIIIEDVKKISQIIGKENVYIRYDPIFLNDVYNLEYHLKAFNKLCSILDGYTSKIIISFLDNYKNVRNHLDILKPKVLTENDYKIIGLNFSQIAKKHHMSVQTCSETYSLEEYGFLKDDCVSKTLVKNITGKTVKKWVSRNNKNCHCVAMVDVASYNTCPHLCKYCYANYDEKQVTNNIKNHNPLSSLLIGSLNEFDEIKVRKN